VFFGNRTLLKFILSHFMNKFLYLCDTIHVMMLKNYFYITLLFSLFSLASFAQDGKQQGNDALGFYPNPVSNGKIYITSKTNLDKDIMIFDVLGKKVLQTTISSRELSITSIPTGVYIIKITEGDTTATRKLIVR
jgi:hypothetical protein